MGFSAGMMSEFRELLRPYYLVNLILCSCFPVCRLASPICDYLFAGNAESPEPCELDMRENEILFFLLIVVMIRSRKTNSMNMVTSENRADTIYNFKIISLIGAFFLI